MNNYFSNKIVVITGGAGGIGSAIISQLLSYNSKIAALDINVDSIPEDKQLLALKCDITNKQELENSIDSIIQNYGRIDILINNAGITHIRKFDHLSEELFDRVMAINFTAAVSITRLCLPYLRKSKGQIVALSSVAGFAPLYGRTAYSASKHAMQGFFGSLAAELKDEGVSVTIVCPSFVKSRPELQVKESSGSQSPGAMKKYTGGEEINPNKAAQLILKTTRQRKSYLYLGRVSKIARLLFTVFPSLYMKIMSQGAKKEFESI